MMIDAGKILGGGSSINVMTWVHGHPSDWDFFASEAGNTAWNSESVGALYREIEDWQGIEDPEFRGKGGLVYVEPAVDPSPLALAMLEASVSLGIPAFPGHNGRLMHSGGGCALVESCLSQGERRSIFRRYVYPVAALSNLSIVTSTQVTRVLCEQGRAVGVEVLHQGSLVEIRAANEVVLGLGAIQSPKILMQSGIGDADELSRLGIEVRMHLPGVGRNYQDHVAMDITWELREPLRPRNSMCEALLFWRSNPALTAPDIQGIQVEIPLASVENSRPYTLPQNGWGFFGGNVRPKSRGFLRLTGIKPNDPIEIHGNELSKPDDLKVALSSVELFRELGNAAPLARFSKREVSPGPLKRAELENFVRNAARTFYHQSCTAKMGTDEMAVVDGQLKVHGISGLRVADVSIMPRITTGNTMAPCVVIGELASRFIRAEWGL